MAIPPPPNTGFQHASFVGYSNLLSVTFRGTGNPSTSPSANGFTLDNIGVKPGPSPS